MDSEIIATLIPDCLSRYVSTRRKQFETQYKDEKISNHFQADFIYRLAVVMKNGFIRNGKKYRPKDIVYAEYKNSSLNGYYWLCEDDRLIAISDEDIYDNEAAFE